MDYEDEEEKIRSNKNHLIIEVEEVKVGFRMGGTVKNYSSIVQKTK